MSELRRSSQRRRLIASRGYAVLAVNQYYRGGKAPVLNSFAEWRTPEGQAKLKPMVAWHSLLYSRALLGFTDYNLIQPPEFNGLENIQRMFTDERLHHALGVTFTYVFVSVPLQLAFALGLAADWVTTHLSW